MKITLSSEKLDRVAVDLLVLSATEGKLPGQAWLAELDGRMAGGLMSACDTDGFKGAEGTQVLLHGGANIKARKVLVVGSGAADGDALARARRLGTAAGRAVRGKQTVAICVADADPEPLAVLSEALALGAYRYRRFKTESGGDAPVRARLLLGRRASAVQRTALQRGSIMADAVSLARDLVNCPPNEMNAVTLADEARRVSLEAGIRCTVWGKRQIEKHGMRLLSAVNAGSRIEPRFVHMTYKPKLRRKLPRLVFVGKGLTFDAGGLCLKPGKSMEAMKCDMAGGAATIALVYAAARLQLPVEVHGVVPATDNMLGDNAYRPGDVYASLDGKTVEIINTDAEGRLILADALAYARALEPTVLVDHATLTGACMVALGQLTAGLYANEDALAERYGQAAGRSGESYWHMPLDNRLRDSLKSSVADLKHTGEAYGGSITAALFLREFVGQAPWIHVDIAGPAFLPGEREGEPRGGTGFGVRTAVEFIRSYA